MTEELVFKSFNGTWESTWNVESIFAKLKVAKQRIAKISYLTNTFAKVTFRYKKRLTNKIVESRPKKWKLPVRHILMLVTTSTKEKQPFSDILQKRCSGKFHNIHRKTTVLESLFNKVAGLTACNFIKRRLRCFLANFVIFVFFMELLRWVLLTETKPKG